MEEAKIEVVPYSSARPERFASEARLLRVALKPWLARHQRVSIRVSGPARRFRGRRPHAQPRQARWLYVGSNSSVIGKHVGGGPVFGSAAPLFVETALAPLRGDWST